MPFTESITYNYTATHKLYSHDLDRLMDIHKAMGLVQMIVALRWINPALTLSEAKVICEDIITNA